MKISNLLAIETSTNLGSIALMTREGEIVERHLEEEAFQGRTLAPLIEGLLKKQGLRTGEIDLVALGRGPGSYTGLRVGGALARAFAYAAGCAMKGVSSYTALAEALGEEGEEVLVTGKAGQDEYYYALYRIRDGRARTVEDHAIGSGEKVRTLCVPGRRVLGDAAADLPEEPDSGSALSRPAASHVARLGLVEYEKGGPDPEEALNPLYLRRSKAEINWERRKAGKKDGPAAE